MTAWWRSRWRRPPPLVTEVPQALLQPPYPATTMVEISRLAAEEWLVEISATAAL